jgi:hypothetical protein
LDYNLKNQTSLSDGDEIHYITARFEVFMTAKIEFMVLWVAVLCIVVHFNPEDEGSMIL